MSAGKPWGGARSPGARAAGGAPAERAAAVAEAAAAAAARRAGRRPAPSRWSGRAVRSTSLRATLLFVWPTFLLFGAAGALLDGDSLGVVWTSAAWLAFVLGAGLTRTGLVAAAAYEARAVAKPPAFPRKLFGAAFTAIGAALASGFGSGDPLFAGVVGALAAGLHVASFGVDPMRAKGVNGLEGDALDEAITKIETARALVADTRAAVARVGDRALEARVAALAESAESVIGRIERDPRDLRRARRFLSVYLVGLRDAAVKFAQTWDENPDPAMRADFAALLDDLEGHFATQREALLLGDRTALDVEIEVLRDRLRLEGV